MDAYDRGQCLAAIRNAFGLTQSAFGKHIESLLKEPSEQPEAIARRLEAGKPPHPKTLWAICQVARELELTTTSANRGFDLESLLLRLFRPDEKREAWEFDLAALLRSATPSIAKGAHPNASDVEVKHRVEEAKRARLASIAPAEERWPVTGCKRLLGEYPECPVGPMTEPTYTVLRVAGGDEAIVLENGEHEIAVRSIAGPIWVRIPWHWSAQVAPLRTLRSTVAVSASKLIGEVVSAVTGHPNLRIACMSKGKARTGGRVYLRLQRGECFEGEVIKTRADCCCMLSFKQALPEFEASESVYCAGKAIRRSQRAGAAPAVKGRASCPRITAYSLIK